MKAFFKTIKDKRLLKCEGKLYDNMIDVFFNNK
jgi:hypothetical protein